MCYTPAMTLDALVMLAGALVAFLAVAGFPPSIYKPLFFVLGLFVIGLGIVVRRMRGRWETAQRLSSRNEQPQAPEQHEAPVAPHEDNTYSAL